MPSYTVSVPDGLLSASQKQQIAELVTRAHNAATGAPFYFAQVIFNEVKPGNYFLGGGILEGNQIFVHGSIRAGRSAEAKSKLMSQIVDGLVPVVGRGNVWVYISELAPSHMIEFGRVLPEHGHEAAWTAALLEAERRRLEAIGVRA
jgi:phenylpyruvate tautomerase PptA (4-oxalocrotonate tautomerase family)